jgi:signal peptidase I
VLLIALVRVLLVETFTVTSDSMTPTLEQGDRLVVLKTADIGIDDVVVLDGRRLLGPTGESAAGPGAALSRRLGADPATAYVKRVVGVPGDRVACCTADGRIIRNGAPVDEPQVRGSSDTVTFDVTVPAGRFWVLGDNRADSADSRAALGRPGGGMLRADDVVGEVVWRFWPRDRWGAVTSHRSAEAVGGRLDAPVVSLMGDTSAQSPLVTQPKEPAS